MSELEQQQARAAVLEARRLSFGRVSEAYDRYRPSYPPQLVDDVIAYAGVGPGDRVLEVGAGTGKATVLFARRGLEVTAVEPDPGMAAVASQRAATAGVSVEQVSADFERAQLPERGFKLLYAATAWHWVAAEARNRLAARVLAPGGALAPFWNRAVWDDHPLRPALDDAYRSVREVWNERPRGPMNPTGSPAEVRLVRGWQEHEFEGTNDFTDVDSRRYLFDQRYSTAEYLDLLGTHSDHQLMSDAARERLFAAIGACIDDAGGHIDVRYESLLCLARRL